MSKGIVKSQSIWKWYFNKFVEKILKKKWKVLYSKDIEKIISQLMWETYTRTKWYKLVHQANTRWHLIILKKDLYYIPHMWEDIWDIIQKWYREVLHTHIKDYLQWKWLITWVTALNLLLQNYEIPDMISLLSTNKQCQEVVIRDKITAIKKMNSWWQSLFSTLKKTAKKITIHKKSFYITSITVSLLEAFYANTENNATINELGKKILRKYRKQIDREEVTMLLRKWKYHTSINKLYYLSRALDDEYANHIMDIIKKHSYRISM